MPQVQEHTDGVDKSIEGSSLAERQAERSDDSKTKSSDKTSGEGSKGKDKSSPKDKSSNSDPNNASDAGGAQLANSDDSDKKNDDNSMKDFMKKAHIVGQGAQASANTGFAIQTVAIAQAIASLLMSMLSSAVAGVTSFFGAIVNFFGAVGTFVANIGITVANGVVAGFTALSSTIAGTFGVGSTAAAVMSTTAVSSAATAAIALGVATAVSVTTRYDVASTDCRTSVYSALDGVKVDANAQMIENAKKVYSVMKTFGLSDVQISGMLGNMHVESSIDPTTIEGIYDEPFQIDGPKHKKAMADFDAHVRGPLSRHYASQGRDHTQNPFYTAPADGKKYPGIGMVQYTGSAARDLMLTSESVNKKWWDLDFQLAYSFAKGAPTGAFGKNFWSKYKAEQGDAVHMANWFAKYFEGNTEMGTGERQRRASSWLSQMSSWTVDKTYGESVIDMAKQLGADAADGTLASAIKKCVKMGQYDNSSLAAAAVSYAYETKDEGRGNDGTPLYRAVHDGVYPGDTLYQSCDRGVACAVKWSGTDVDYPSGDAPAQLNYMMSSPKWKHVGDADSLSMEDLLPGDVFSIRAHIFLYVGHEAVIAKYPDAPSYQDSVSASWHERSPGVCNDSNDIVVRMKGQDWLGRGVYKIFRCVQPDNSDEFKHIGSSIS